MANREEPARSTADKYYVDGDKLDPAEIIGGPLMDIETAEDVLSRLIQPQHDVAPKDCLRLFYAIADLRLTNWDFVEMLWTPQRRKAVEEAATELHRRLAGLLDRKREALLDSLEQGICDEIEFIKRNLTNAHYREYDMEFTSEVLFPYERLDYIRLLLRTMRVSLSAPTEGLLEQLDTSMQQSLPTIAKNFRDAGQPIDPIEPRIFPESFWWARLSGSSNRRRA